jgi:hypothetical protein
MTIGATAFARRRADDVFFPAMALFALATVVMGFGHAYFFAGMMAAELPSPLVHVHAAILSAWIALQALQPVLVAAGRVDWHRRVGLAGMAVAAIVPVIGVLAVIGEIRRHAQGADDLASDFAFVLAAAVDFAVLAFLGLEQRNRDLSAHKRLMLLATISILGPAVGRLSFVITDLDYYAALAFFAALIVAFDLLSLGRIHRATILGVAVIATSQALADVFSRTTAALHLVTWIQAV